MADVLYILSSAMSLLRRCRVNAALTIQLFSQLFHYLNMWLFNKLVLEPQRGLCTKAWGRRLKRRLGYVEAWAEKQGLELAADCHLCRVVQVRQLYALCKCLLSLLSIHPYVVIHIRYLHTCICPYNIMFYCIFPCYILLCLLCCAIVF